LRKLLFIVLLIPLLAGLGWWYFQERALPDYGPAYREYAYVNNGKSNTVSVIDLRTFELAKTIPVGTEPTGIAASGKKNEIYAVNSGSSNVSVIDAEKNAVVATIGVQGRPYFIDISEDGKRAYVANSGSANVSVIDLDKRVVIGTVPVGSAPGLARVSRDGATVVVSNRGDDSVSLIDAKLLRVRATLPVCRHPEDIAILPDSSKAFVTCSGSSQVASIALKASEGTADRVLALLDTLRYVEMGGRVSRAQAMIGTMLDLKPLLLMVDGEIKSLDRVRTRSRAIPRMVEFFEKDSPVEHVGVVHAQATDEAEQIAAALRGRLPGLEVPVGQIGCVLGTHVGPKALGLVYIKK